jgi:uncharacterized protein (TIGR02246 family)
MAGAESDDERAIRELVDRWMAASRAGEIEPVLELMTDDVLFMVPGREPFGKGQFRAISESMRGAAMDGHAEIAEIQVLGDWAWIRNRITASMTPPGGPPVSRAGYTLTILRKGGDGRWRLFRDANLVS